MATESVTSPGWPSSLSAALYSVSSTLASYAAADPPSPLPLATTERRLRRQRSYSDGNLVQHHRRRRHVPDRTQSLDEFAIPQACSRLQNVTTTRGHSRRRGSLQHSTVSSLHPSPSFLLTPPGGEWQAPPVCRTTSSSSRSHVVVNHSSSSLSRRDTTSSNLSVSTSFSGESLRCNNNSRRRPRSQASSRSTSPCPSSSSRASFSDTSVGPSTPTEHDSLSSGHTSSTLSLLNRSDTSSTLGMGRSSTRYDLDLVSRGKPCFMGDLGIYMASQETSSSSSSLMDEGVADVSTSTTDTVKPIPPPPTSLALVVIPPKEEEESTCSSSWISRFTISPTCSAAIRSVWKMLGTKSNHKSVTVLKKVVVAGGEDDLCQRVGIDEGDLKVNWVDECEGDAANWKSRSRRLIE